MKMLRKVFAVIALTFRESFAKKTFIVFFALTTLLHIFFIFALSIDIVDGAMAMVHVLGNDIEGQTIDIEKMITTIQSVIASLVFTGGIFLSIFATANLVPTMLEKGNIELMVSKPLSRPLLLVSRFIGAQSVMVLNVVYLIVGSWLILSMKTGFWHVPYLYSIPMVVFSFAVLYALMTLIGVTTRSPGVSIMIAYFILFLSPFLDQKDRIYALLSSKIYYYLLEGIYYILPRTFELGEINQQLVMGEVIDSWSALLTSGCSGAAMLLLAVFIFSRKDF